MFCPREAEFHQLIGTAMSGSVARFVGNELFVIFWHRTTLNPELVFGAEINLNGFTKDFERLIQPDYDLAKTVCVALLDDKGKPVVTTTPGFVTNWKRPFVATEVGEVLPHWEVGVYLLNPAAANQIAVTIQRSVGATIVLLLVCDWYWKLAHLAGSRSAGATGSAENRFCQQRFARVENASDVYSHLFGIASQQSGSGPAKAVFGNHRERIIASDSTD